MLAKRKWMHSLLWLSLFCPHCYVLHAAALTGTKWNSSNLRAWKTSYTGFRQFTYAAGLRAIKHFLTNNLLWCKEYCWTDALDIFNKISAWIASILQKSSLMLIPDPSNFNLLVEKMNIWEVHNTKQHDLVMLFSPNVPGCRERITQKLETQLSYKASLAH